MKARAVLFLLSAATALAQDVTFRSGPARTSLLELYASEGCSSCPPAEEWLSKLTTDERLWKDFVPAAFHVTYWDTRKWQDRFARKEFDARQQGYANLWEETYSYTPCFALDGKEWLDWKDGKAIPQPSARDVGRLVAMVRDDGDVEVLFTPLTKVEPPIRAHVCVLGFGLTSDVTSGENRGRKLTHDFVARDWQIVLCGLTNQTYRCRTTIARPAGRAALAVWISGKGVQTPLQAVGGWLPAADERTDEGGRTTE